MVTPNFWYIVHAEECRPHFCSNYYLAQAVKRNLLERYGKHARITKIHGESLAKDRPRVFFLDQGSQSHRRPYKNLALSENVVVSWLAHEEEEIQRVLEQEFPLAPFKYGSFHKIHCSTNTLCLTFDQAQALYDCVVKNYVNSSYSEEW